MVLRTIPPTHSHLKLNNHSSVYNGIPITTKSLSAYAAEPSEILKRPSRDISKQDEEHAPAETNSAETAVAKLPNGV